MRQRKNLWSSSRVTMRAASPLPHDPGDRTATFPLILVGALLLGTLARIGLAAASLGSNDIFTWYHYAASIREQGLLDVYRTTPLFNHPPLAGMYAEGVLAISGSTQLLFAFLFKLPSIVADIGVAILLWDRWRQVGDGRRAELAAAAFSLSPLAILISGYHGNTDSVVAFLAFLAVYLASSRGLPFAAGLALAAACNVKVIPMLLALPIVLALARPPGMARFVAGLSLGLIPLGVTAVVLGSVFYGNVFAYNSQLDNWGIFLFVLQGSHWPGIGQSVADFGNAYIAMGRYVIMGSVALIGWAFRRSLYESAALTMCLFVVLAPGFGVQYLIYVVPFLFAVSVRWGICFSAIAGFFLLLVYAGWGNGQIPLESHFRGPVPVPVALIGLLAWISLVAFAWGRAVTGARDEAA